MIYFNSILLIILWYFYIELYIKYHRLKQQKDNNNKSIELLEKAFDTYMACIYRQLDKLKKEIYNITNKPQPPIF